MGCTDFLLVSHAFAHVPLPLFVFPLMTCDSRQAVQGPRRVVAGLPVSGTAKGCSR